MLNIVNHQGNANQNCNEISFHICQNDHHQKRSQITKCWQRCRENESLYSADGNSNGVQQLWKTVWRFLKNLKIGTPHDSTIPLFSRNKKNKSLTVKDICTPVFIAALFTVAKIWKQPTDKWMKVWYIYIQCNSTSP